MVVYPRWRGELDRTASVVSSGSGLSPLARGTPVFANLWTIAIRFIRWRGEHGRTEYKAVYLLGLSSLARGTLALQQQHP